MFNALLQRHDTAVEMEEAFYARGLCPFPTEALISSCMKKHPVWIVQYVSDVPQKQSLAAEDAKQWYTPGHGRLYQVMAIAMKLALKHAFKPVADADAPAVE